MSVLHVQSSENNEQIVRTFRPAPVSVAVGPLYFWLFVLVIAVVGAGTHVRWGFAASWWPWIAIVLAGLTIARLLWEILNWWCTRYELTTERVSCRFGVLSRVTIEIPLHRIQNVTIVRRFRDRIAGVGSIGIDSAGTSSTEVWWLMVDQPEATAGEVRKLMPSSNARAAAVRPDLPKPLVVGLAGSIGAGKSTAAGFFRELGCMVIDSDAEARAALDRPEIRDTLRGWWGQGVIGADGKVDRRAVGAIVFADAAERTRLERLIHPLVRKQRAEFIARAIPAGPGATPMVVIDVPLLYEAGIDAECDAVVFIDAPREVRLARVAHRGWDDAELAKREAAQWPVADKKARADERLENTGDLESLRDAVRQVAERILARPRPPRTGERH